MLECMLRMRGEQRAMISTSLLAIFLLTIPDIDGSLARAFRARGFQVLFGIKNKYITYLIRARNSI